MTAKECFSRTPVPTVLENLESGAPVSEIMEWFDVTQEKMAAVLEFAGRSLDAPAARCCLTMALASLIPILATHGATKARDAGLDLTNGERLGAAEAAGLYWETHNGERPELCGGDHGRNR